LQADEWDGKNKKFFMHYKFSPEKEEISNIYYLFFWIGFEVKQLSRVCQHPKHQNTCLSN